MEVLQGNTIGFIGTNELSLCAVEEKCYIRPVDFCQKYNKTDIPNIQVSLSEIGSTLLADGTFDTACGVNWICDPGWIIGSGKATGVQFNAGDKLQSEDISLVLGERYKVSFNIASILGDQTITYSLGGIGYTVEGEGTHTIYHSILTPPTNQKIEFLLVGANDGYFLDNVEVVLMETVGYSIKNSTTTVLTVLDGTGVTYFDNKPIADISFDLSALPDAKYCIEIINTNNLFTDGNNGTFETDILTITGGADFIVGQSNAQAKTGTGSMRAQSSGVLSSPETVFNLSALTLKPNTSYYIETYFYADVATYDTNDEGNLLWLLSGFVGATIIENVATWQDTHALQSWVKIALKFKTAADFTGTIGMNYFFDNSDLTLEQNMYFDDASLVEIGLKSQCIDVKNEHDCTLLLKWFSTDKANGFDYNEGLIHQMRVEGLLRNSSYSKDKETHRNSNGDRTILYADTSIEKELSLNEVPEYMHDSIALGIDSDSFSIDDVDHVFEGDAYEPDYRNSSVLSPVQIDVFKKNQNFVNNNC